MTYPEEHNYQSADEGYESDGPEPLTAEEIEYIDSKIEECKDSLAGVVTASQIEKKIIDLDFDGDKFDDWAKTLMPSDKKYAGVKEFEWNNTTTK